MTDSHAIARAYIELWNDVDDASRRDLLSKAWSADARYIDPMMQGAGHDGIAAMIGKAHAQFPSHRFTLVGTPDGHGNFVRFSWTLAPDGGAIVAAGTDVVRLNAQGRIGEVIGFLDGGAA
ncbi:nuclear transport factor 2 family protein [Altererythrobacter xixiisoli]|uniref:Nuclear transport factor 2 family protein n=1 Tax=Croceibacterium xixiisoli TaxID=1476466 RepID=A0A6I4TPK5_9SPHN|nr:nuclear transport factor 2 family protein [Croceibacterium xixiisoli]MXO98045.1 nuclear transport factor 2 family protein [Croceibacterium xixiisoli]